MKPDFQLERLKLADYVLDACGVPHLPDGTRRVPLFRTMVYNNVAPASTYLPNEKKSTEVDTFFILSSISIDILTNPNALVYLRFQWPNGRYFTDVEELIQTGYGRGGSRRSLGAIVIPNTYYRGVACPPGSTIRFTVNNKGTTPLQLVINFHGCDLYSVGPGDTPPCCVTHL